MLNRKEAHDIINLSQFEKANLLRTATSIRQTYWGNTVTYSRKVFIPLTNMCRDQCRYCTFVQTPDSGKAHLMTPEEVLRTALQGQNSGCKEALFSLGERPELRYSLAKQQLHQQGYNSTVDYLHDMAEQVLEKSLLIPHINAGALTFKELQKLKPVSGSMGMMVESLTDNLMKKGQAHHGCPDKLPLRRLNTLRYAGQLDIPFTTGILIGIGETWQERIDSLYAINQLHLEYGHIQEVIIQNFRAKSGTPMQDTIEPTLQDMMMTLAAARLILHPSISLQAPPNLENSHQKYLDAGINDWGGISPITKDFINPERAWPQISQLAEECHRLGYELSERLTVYPSYLKHGDKYLEPNIASRLASLASAEGQAAVQCHIA
ncbi:7,8-didemethyl-8-hydroxy-5-deazariboflavin synthase CofG [Vibrio sp.]|nr:7,8-didemethyl-8-hydroxy-5-deazariboflavin synthase CofG [Vibrio sp.]